MTTVLRLPSLALTMTVVIGCTGQVGDPATTTDVAHVNDPSTMKYTKVDPPNAVGFAKVTAGEGETHAEGIIDAKGVETIPPRTSLLVNDITGSTALVQSGRAFLFVDLSQGPVDTALFATTKGYEYAEPFRYGRAMVKLDDRWFYIDTAGNALFNQSYDFAETFHENRAMVMRAGRFRIIDSAGRTVADLDQDDQVNPQSPWCWQVTRINGDAYLSGFIDLDGKKITPLIYDVVGYYDPEVERIRVGKDDKYGFLDEHAQEVIPVKYEHAEIFDHGKARVVLNGREFFIDPEGNEVAE